MLESGEICTAIGYVENLPAVTKQRVLRRDGGFVLHDAHTPGPVDLEACCAGPHTLVSPRGELTGFADEETAKLGRSRRVVLGVPDYALMLLTLMGTDLLCLASGVVWDVLLAIGWGGPVAADSAPFPCEEVAMHLAWRPAFISASSDCASRE